MIWVWPCLAISQSHRASSELIRRHLGINEGLILGVAQDCRIRHSDSTFCAFPACTIAVTYMSFFSFSPGFMVSIRAGKVRVVGIERSRYIRDASVKSIRISVGLNA